MISLSWPCLMLDGILPGYVSDLNEVWINQKGQITGWTTTTTSRCPTGYQDLASKSAPPPRGSFLLGSASFVDRYFTRTPLRRPWMTQKRSSGIVMEVIHSPNLSPILTASPLAIE